MKNFTKGLSALLLLCLVLPASAQKQKPQFEASLGKKPIMMLDEQKVKPKPDSVVKEEGKLSISGYLDSYYFTNFNNPSSRDNMGQSGVGRGFDRRVDQFQLGMVQTVFKYTNKKSEMVADLAFGPSAQYGNYGNVPNFTPNKYGYSIGNDVYSAVIIKQAYFKYNATDKLNFIMGQFGTHIGYEYIDAPLNYFYSINHTFNSGIPFYHTGIKGTYAFSDKVSLMLGVVNGFDYVHDNNRSKGLIGQLSLAPAKGLSIYFNYINTNESDANAQGSTPDGNFTVYDLNGGYQVTEKFFIGYWFMLGSQYGRLGSPGTFEPADSNYDKTITWGGANLYFINTFSDLFSLGFRGEYFNNSSGARGLRNFDPAKINTNISPISNNQINQYGAIGATAMTYTLTGTFTLADGHLLLKPELRMDVFDKVEGVGKEKTQQFIDSKGEYTNNSQTTLGMAAIYKF
jgi:Putative beta-barrel porin-2, OmpL-like. bbp2